MNKNLHVVTGASQGLGSALAKHLAAKGDDVAVINRKRDLFISPRIQEVLGDLSAAISAGDPLGAILAHRALKDYKRITLTNNAGLVGPISPVQRLREDQIAENLAVNLRAPIVLASQFLNRLRDFDEEVILVNVSSGVARRPKGSWSVYSAAKAGLEAFTIALNKEVADRPKLRALTFDPGIMDTNMQAKIRSAEEADFPELRRFISFKENGELLPAERVASALARLLGNELPPAEKQHFTVEELLS